PFGTRELAGFHVGFIRDASLAYTIASPDYKLETDQWVHLALVLDIPSKTISTYVNGERVGNTENFDLELDQFFTHENKLYIGRSLNDGSPFLDAKVGDFRIYRIPLEESQIARIRYNALRGGQGSGPRERPADNLPQFDPDTPQLYHEFLIAVSDVAVETPVGTLPRLPRYVKGTYSNGKEGPPVRVIWPAPTDNSSVLRSGSHTITGRVSGTDFAPKAVVTVKAGLGENAPDRTLEAFALDQVALNADLQGNKTKFIENRDKFINTLAGTNTDSFLYMFRNAFGQQQPEGAKPLGVWDSQETKLRGHATGHYLTALAQAYAGTGYDKALQANFAQKMDYMVEVLYALSQLSGTPQKPGGEFISDPTKVPPVAGKTQYDSDLSEAGIRTDYWNWGKGFISAYPPDQFIMLEQGATYGTQTTQIWAPYYTLHKIMAGLMDIYEVSGNEKALDVAKGMGGWVHARLSQLSTQTLISMWDLYIAGEFGGMNEAMARLERISGETRYLETARLFDNIRMFFGDAQHSHGVAKNVDSFRGLHANQHIP